MTLVRQLDSPSLFVIPPLFLPPPPPLTVGHTHTHTLALFLFFSSLARPASLPLSHSSPLAYFLPPGLTLFRIQTRARSLSRDLQRRILRLVVIANGTLFLHKRAPVLVFVFLLQQRCHIEFRPAFCWNQSLHCPLQRIYPWMRYESIYEGGMKAPMKALRKHLSKLLHFALWVICRAISCTSFSTIALKTSVSHFIFVQNRARVTSDAHLIATSMSVLPNITDIVK